MDYGEIPVKSRLPMLLIDPTDYDRSIKTFMRLYKLLVEYSRGDQ